MDELTSKIINRISSIFTLLGSIFLIAGCRCPDVQPIIVMGNLSPDDLAQIIRLVHSDMTGIPPDQLPDKHRKFQPIQGLRANPDGTVEVVTGVQNGPVSGSGHTYKIQKGAQGWEIKSKSQWISHILSTCPTLA